ncbi:MAG TPA: hypothetical protein VHL50_08780 [Pyrinomonadaceae bacterium]|nr:hypothetical protein [Pyrinomonadaceae bacterium]
MKKLLPVILFLFALPAFGQASRAEQIDAFGNIPCDEYLARAERMMTEQANNPDAQIYVFVYEGKEKRAAYKNGKFAGSTYVLPSPGLAKARIESMRKLLKSYKRPLENYVFVNGGFREEFTVEIWLVPAGAEPPKAAPSLEKMNYRKGRAYGFCLSCC